MIARALSEVEPKAKAEVSAKHAGKLSECEPKAKHELS